MPFSIRFLEEPPFRDECDDGSELLLAHGSLQIGEWSEGFYAGLHEWTSEQYESQWREAIHQIVHGASKAALIVYFASPDCSGHLEWWPMYREGDSVFLQNHLLFFSQLPKPFSLDAPFESLRERQIVDEDGTQISEWHISFSDIQEFALSLDH